jgi:hypothetical protein
MRLSPLAAVAAACVLTLTACGDDGDEPESSDKGDTSASPSADEPTKDKGDKGDDQPEDDGDPNTSVCDGLEAKDVSEIVGGNLKKGQVGSGCLLTDSSNPAGTSVSLSEAPLSSLGGEENLENALRAVKGKPEELSDIGDQAYLVVGKGGLLGNGNAAAGLVVIDDTVVQVSVTPSADVTKAQLKEQTVEVMELIADSV